MPVQTVAAGRCTGTGPGWSVAVETADSDGRVLTVRLVNGCNRAVALKVTASGTSRTVTIRPKSTRTIDVAALIAQPVFLNGVGFGVQASGA